MQSWRLTARIVCRAPISSINHVELESYFFVILYKSVHWVIHNRPDRFNVTHMFIFHDVGVNANGRQTDGVGVVITETDFISFLAVPTRPVHEEEPSISAVFRGRLMSQTHSAFLECCVLERVFPLNIRRITLS